MILGEKGKGILALIFLKRKEKFERERGEERGTIRGKN